MVRTRNDIPHVILKCDAIGQMVGQIHVELGVGHLELGKA